MPLQKLQFKPGINKEVTRNSAEGGWYECDKVRFRFGFPEKIGGWQAVSQNTFEGVCRSLFQWSVLSGAEYRGVGTHLRYYIEQGGAYFELTPARKVTTGTATFSCVSGSSTIEVSDPVHGVDSLGAYVTFSSAAQLGASNITAAVLNKEYFVTPLDSNRYTFTATDSNGDELLADATVSGGGGGATVAEYQESVGLEINKSLSGWSAGEWDAASGSWSDTIDLEASQRLRLWSQNNFGEDLIINPRGYGLYYYDFSSGLTANRPTPIADLAGASDTPLFANISFVSDISRFVFCFGVNELGQTTLDPMLIRWSDQENAANWTPSATNQAGGVRLSRGNKIQAVIQSRQEILVWTDTSLYSLQYVGSPIVWSTQIVGENISIVSQNSPVSVDGVVYWMGKNRFYRYSGRIEVLPCTLNRYVFSDINKFQADQIFSGLNERFNEVWWLYPSAESDTVDRYVVFNYAENVWYYGNLARTAWYAQDNITAATYNYKLVEHEVGQDDKESTDTVGISSFIRSAATDIADGDQFSFIWRVLPDVTFVGSSAPDPTVTVNMEALKNSGAAYNNPASEGGNDSGSVVRSNSLPVETFTEQLNIRMRGRQLIFELSSADVGVAWQLGSPAIDVRTDGKR